MVQTLDWAKIAPGKRMEKNYIYVTDGNIMYLTDASRFLICCVIQHYAPVGWGGGGVEEQMHNVDYVPGP
jgi:hypothetical protein